MKRASNRKKENSRRRFVAFFGINPREKQQNESIPGQSKNRPRLLPLPCLPNRSVPHSQGQGDYPFRRHPLPRMIGLLPARGQQRRRPSQPAFFHEMKPGPFFPPFVSEGPWLQHPVRRYHIRNPRPAAMVHESPVSRLPQPVKMHNIMSRSLFRPLPRRRIFPDLHPGLPEPAVQA